MKAVLIAPAFLAMLLPAQERPEVSAAPAEATGKAWTVRGIAAMRDGTELAVAVTRIERIWEEKASKFRRILSDSVRRRGTGAVKARAFEASMKAAPTGLYRLTVAEKEALFEATFSFGSVPHLFSDSAGQVRKLAEIIEKAGRYLEEIEKIVESPEPPTKGQYEDFQARVAADTRRVEDAGGRTDLTATVRVLTEIFRHLRDAQVWNRGGPSAARDNDEALKGKGRFLDPNLTFASLRERILGAKAVLSREIRVSIAALLDELFARAPQNERGLERARDGAREAKKLAAEAPEPDEEFAKKVEEAAGGADPEKARAGLRPTLEAWVAKD